MGLFDEQLSRKPNLYPWTDEFIDAIWNSPWTPSDFNFKADITQFEIELTDEERKVVTRTLSAIGQIEIAVKTFWARLGDNLPHPCLVDLGLVMGGNEVLHNKAYEKLLDKLKLDHIFQDNLNEPIVKGRVEYLRKYNKKVYTDARKQYIYAIILFTLFVENVSLFSQFYIILWFHRFRKVLPQTAQQVFYTRLEENLHARVGIRLINILRSEYPEMFDEELEDRIRHECQEAVKAESAIIDWIIGDYTGRHLSADILKAYIQNRMDDSLVAIGVDKVFGSATDPALVEQTLWTEEELFGNTKTDFFAMKPVEYASNNKSYDEEEELF